MCMTSKIHVENRIKREKLYEFKSLLGDGLKQKYDENAKYKVWSS